MMEYRQIKIPQEIQDAMNRYTATHSWSTPKPIKIEKPIAGIRLQVPLTKGQWSLPLPLNTKFSTLPELQDFVHSMDIASECILKPDYIHKGIYYSLHTCDYHEYVIIEWTGGDTK